MKPKDVIWLTVSLVVIGIAIAFYSGIFTPKAIDLDGTWTFKEDSGQITTAIVKGNSIEIYFSHEDNDTQILYWAGDFTKGMNNTWTSKRDTTKTSGSILGSDEDSKKFTVKNNSIIFDVTEYGVTTNIVLKRTSK